MRDETFFSLALSLTPGIGKRRLQRLITECQAASKVFSLTRQQLKRFGLSAETRAALLSGRSLKAAEEAIAVARQKGVQLLSPADDAYPPLLREIHDPPLVLYALGEAELLHRPALALVGSRRCSVYGREVSLKLARDLASLGLTIVSGLARGVDCKAHQGALEVGGGTVAVLGCGVDVVYPRENKSLYERIRRVGCVLSEFPCGSFPAPQNFPIRNRIISGVGYGTIISEASEFSGSLITARLTLEQDRELWAVPGNVTSPGSYGPNYLIKQGARVAITAQDVIDELPITALDRLRRESGAKPPPVEDPKPPIDPSEELVLAALPVDVAIHFDRLLELSGLRLEALNHALLGLEMRGLIRQMPGRRFSRRLF